MKDGINSDLIMNVIDLNILKSKVLIHLYLQNKALQDSYKELFSFKPLGSEENLNLVIDDLKSVSLVEGETIDSIRLTASGVYEVEIKYFNPVVSNNVNIITVTNMINSAIMQGSPEGNITLTMDAAKQIKQQLFTNVDEDIAKIVSALMDNQSNAESLIKRYYTKLLDELNSFEIHNFDGALNRHHPWGNKVQESVERMFPLRNKFLELFIGIIDNSTSSVEKLLHHLLGQLLQYNFLSFEFFTNKNLLGYLRYDNYRIFIYELYLYLCAYLIKQERFNELSYILHYPYLVNVKDDRGRDNYISVNFSKFNFPTDLINSEIRRDNLGIYDDRDLLVQFIISRNDEGIVSIKLMKETDVLLYYISLLSETILEGVSLDPLYWSPFLSKERVVSIDVMKRSISKSFFEKMRTIFNVASTDEFFQKVRMIPSLQRSHLAMVERHRINTPDNILNLQFIAKQP